MKSIIDLKEEYKRDITGLDPAKENPEKFMVSYLLAEPENKELLKEYNVTLKPSDWIVLTLEPETLKKRILRAKDLGFLDAYIQTPSFLKSDVDVIIKRMSELEHLGVPYKNEKGKYLSYLFSNRGYAYVLNEQGKKKNSISGIKNVELMEYANRIMETFAIETEKENVYSKLSIAESEGLGIKEALIYVFKSYSDNLEYLNNCIDEIIKNNEERRGRVAWST